MVCLKNDLFYELERVSFNKFFPRVKSNINDNKQNNDTKLNFFGYFNEYYIIKI